MNRLPPLKMKSKKLDKKKILKRILFTLSAFFIYKVLEAIIKNFPLEVPTNIREFISILLFSVCWFAGFLSLVTLIHDKVTKYSIIAIFTVAVAALTIINGSLALQGITDYTFTYLF